MIVKAYAKINVSLNVLGKRNDGYHELDTIMLPLELHDSIEINIIKGFTNSFVTCDDFTLLPSQYNLAHQAIARAREIFGFKEQFRVNIHKSIPMAAGLGGGSSDAASVLYAVCKLLKIHPSVADLLKIAEKLGSDVPFFLYNLPARVKGRGEKILPIDVATHYRVLIVKPKDSLLTKDVFAKSDEMKLDTFDINSVLEGLEKGNDDQIASSIGNSLLQPASTFSSDIMIIINKLKEFGFKIVSMSGSGPTVFALTTDKKLLSKAASYFEKRECTVERTQLLL